MKRFLAPAIALFLVCLPQSALADVRKFTVRNASEMAISNVVVRGGEIKGSSRIAPGSTKTFDVVVPHGQCRVTIRVLFVEDVRPVDEPYYNLCRYDTMTVTVRYG